MMNLSEISRDYHRDGFVSGVEIVSEDEARRHRAALEDAEGRIGPLHYKAKVHTVLRSSYELATHPRILDIVEAIIGPDILLYDVEYIIKEPHTPSHVSWHQDLTYWGLDGDDLVSLWMALSPANADSGCMRMIAGSHKAGEMRHRGTDDPTNVLLQGQTVDDVSDADAVLCPLRPGEASFHHGWTLHASMPNVSDDRRIGFNAQYMAPHLRQTKHELDSAMLVRGRDVFGHFETDRRPDADFLPDAMANWTRLNDLHVATQGSR